jgi:hypothetical protein
MQAKKPAPGKKYFTAAQANAMLPLVRSIVKDLVTLIEDLRERHERRSRIGSDGGVAGDAYNEELRQFDADFERDQERLQGYADELQKLGIELKDPCVGLIDFPCRLGDRDVYLCWRLGEDEVGHWHELDAGFAGRQKLTADVPCS